MTLAGLLVAPGLVLADPPEPAGPRPASKAPDGAKAPEAQAAADRKAILRQFRALAEERNQIVRERGALFSRITVGHDYSGEYVLSRDKEVTAFLDLTDPRHPRYAPGHGDDDDGPRGDPRRRCHILVVPNEPREHIGKTLTSEITAEDLERALRVVRAAGALAARLGVKHPQIYIKAAQRVGVGYLHVHLVGERDPDAPYPPPLKPPLGR